MEEFTASRVLGVGQSTSPRLAPGRKFELIEHPLDQLNREYLVTSASYAGKQAALATSTGGNGDYSVLDPHAYQSVLAARSSDIDAVRCLAEALLQISARVNGG